MSLTVGIFVDSLRIPIIEGLKVAADIGAECFQVYLTREEMLASNMDADARKDFVKRYCDLGLTLSATCGDFRVSFADDEKMKQVEPLLQAAIDQTVDLGSSIITTHIGSVHDDPDKTAVMVGWLKRIGDYAAQRGITLATETGMESGETLRNIIASTETKGIAVNMDPANLIMGGFDLHQSVCDLKGLIVHSHAKDGVRDADGTPHETPLGEGGVNFPAYTRLMDEIGFDGAYVIEREAGDDPIGDVTRAVEFLKGL